MLDERLKPFLGLIVPIGVAAAGFVVAKVLTVESVELAAPTGWVPKNIAGAETAARWWVATTTTLLLAAAVGAMAGAWYILHEDSAGAAPYRRYAIVAFAIMAVAGGLFVGFGLPPAYADLGRAIFAGTIGTYPNSPASTSPPASLGGLEAIARIADIATLVAGAAIASVAAALMAPAPPVAAGNPPLVDRDAVESNARALVGRIRQLKLLLFLAAAVLVLSLVQAEAWRGWPAAYWPDKTGLAEFQTAVRATVSFRAALYVAVLAAIFLPTAIRLRDAGRYLAAIHPNLPDEAAHKRWLGDTGLTLSFGEQTKRLLAIVTPFLAVAATALFDKLAALWPTLFSATPH